MLTSVRTLARHAVAWTKGSPTGEVLALHAVALAACAREHLSFRRDITDLVVTGVLLPKGARMQSTPMVVRRPCACGCCVPRPPGGAGLALRSAGGERAPNARAAAAHRAEYRELASAGHLPEACAVSLSRAISDASTELNELQACRGPARRFLLYLEPM